MPAQLKNGTYESGVVPGGTAAGVPLQGGAGPGGPTRRVSQAEDGSQGERLQVEACLAAPQGVKGGGEVGQRLEMGPGGVRLRGGGRENAGMESGGCVGGGGGKLLRGWRRR